MMRILGLGCDLLRIERIARIGTRHGQILLERVLAPTEHAALAGFGGTTADWLARAPRIAACIAAKEAFFKALGTGLVVPLRWADVAVDAARSCSDITLQGASAERFASLGGLACRLALSGNDRFVHATVLLLGWPPELANQQPTITQRLTTGDQQA